MKAPNLYLISQGLKSFPATHLSGNASGIINVLSFLVSCLLDLANIVLIDPRNIQVASRVKSVRAFSSFSSLSPRYMAKEKERHMVSPDWSRDLESCTSNSWISCPHYRKPYRIKRTIVTAKERCLHMRCFALCWVDCLNLTWYMCCQTYCFVLVMGTNMSER